MAIKQGIILTGGSGTRLRPQTFTFNKHLIPIYNRAVLDFPLKTLRELGVNDLTVVLGGDHQDQVVQYLKYNSNGFDSINYVHQSRPSGIAQAINLCSSYITDDKFYCILGDNFFQKPVRFNNTKPSAQIVLHQSTELNRFGVASILNGRIIKIEEKPTIINDQVDNFAITGLYQFDLKYFEYFKNLKLSARSEFEIVDVINQYHSAGELYYTVSNGDWSDMGTHESIYHVSSMIRDQEFKSK